ncbi:MAG: hypothetical protein H7276_18910 [Caulobacter sp.]|nr:hypothetical protein [Vitreoscilla sp.]
MPDVPHGDSESDSFTSSLDDMLERVSAATRAEQEARENELRTPETRTARTFTEPAVTPAAAQAAAAARTGARADATTLLDVNVFGIRQRAWSVVGVVALGAVVAWTALRFGTPPGVQLTLENLPPTAAGSPSSAPATPAAPAPVAVASMATPNIAPAILPAIANDADASTEAIMLEQLRAGSATSAATEAPLFAIARYDSLPAASQAWRVLVPLAVEEVYALVPATSRLRELDDLRGRRINIGVAASPRARSAEALYRTLFGQPVPPSPLRAAPKEVALPALLHGEGLDAMLLFDGQPSSWLAALPVETRLRLKVLRFDPTRSSGQRALQSYLSARVDPPLVGEPAPVPTLGEVTFLVASRTTAASPELVRRLCERLPALQADGHPKWKEIDPAVQLPLQLPPSPEIASALQACETSRRSSTPSSGALSS